MNTTNKAILEKANAAITAGNYEGFLAYCTEDSTWTFVGDQILEGKPAIRAYMATTYEEPPKFRVERLIAEGEYVTALGQISPKNEEGKTVDYNYCDVWRFQDGKMTELTAFVIEHKP